MLHTYVYPSLSTTICYYYHSLLNQVPFNWESNTLSTTPSCTFTAVLGFSSARGTWAEEHQAGLQGLQLDLGLEVVELHGLQDLVHGHVELVQTGRSAQGGETKGFSSPNKTPWPF